MPLPIPNLDDKSFSELIEETTKLIPIYTPEWTDHNIHDPGITFLELFAWLSEIQIYSLNLITDRHLLKYLRLLGIEPLPATPSKAVIQMTSVDSLNISACKLLKAILPDSEVPFETDEDIEVMPLELKKIISYTNYQLADVTKWNEPQKVYYYAFGEHPKKGDILYLGLGSEKDLALKTLRLGIYLFEEDLPLVGQHGEEKLKVYPSAKVDWEYWNSHEWKSLKIEATEETIISLSSSGIVSFECEQEEEAIRKERIPYLYDSFDIEEEYFWIRARIDQSGYEIPPRIDRIIPNVVTATQGKEETEFIEGRGLPYQVFNTQRYPIISGSQKIRNVEAQEWSEVAGFNFSKPDDCHYVISPDKGEIHFGDGKKGSIPPKGAEIEIKYQLEEAPTSEEQITILSTGLTKQIIKIPEYPIVAGSQTVKVVQVWQEADDFDSSKPDDFHYMMKPDKGEVCFGDGERGTVLAKDKKIKITYKYGGGTKGNVVAGTIVTIDFPGVAVSNPFPACGGREKESIEEAFIRFRKDLKIPYPAVTALDYEYIAKATPGLRVARAKALVTSENTVVVIVVPYSPFKKPIPSEGFKRTVCEHLDMHRLITTYIKVKEPDYVRVSVNTEIRIKPACGPELLRERINKALNKFLSPIKREPDDNAWPFGRAVYKSEVYEAIEGVDGVDCVLRLSLRGEEGNFRYKEGNIEIGNQSIVYPGRHIIEIFEPQILCKRGDNE